jgi:hypothetical protein
MALGRSNLLSGFCAKKNMWISLSGTFFLNPKKPQAQCLSWAKLHISATHFSFPVVEERKGKGFAGVRMPADV